MQLEAQKQELVPAKKLERKCRKDIIRVLSEDMNELRPNKKEQISLISKRRFWPNSCNTIATEEEQFKYPNYLKSLMNIWI